jgi:hypothetical protein
MLVLVNTMSLDQVREPAILREFELHFVEVSRGNVLVRAGLFVVSKMPLTGRRSEGLRLAE